VANRKGEVFKLVFNSAHRNIDTPICNVDLSPPKEPGKPENAKTNAGLQQTKFISGFANFLFPCNCTFIEVEHMGNRFP